MRITRNVSGLLLVSLIAALVAMMIFIPRTSGYARESVVTLAGRRTSEPSTSRYRKHHKGKRAGDQECLDDTKVVRYEEMPARLSDDKKSVEMIPDIDQLKTVFTTAFDECFMEGRDILPGYGEQNQHDVHDFPTSGGTSRLYLRPAANIAITSFSILKRNEGFIAADIYNGSNVDFTNDDLNGDIPSGHSAFLWVGKDKYGASYAAVIDLAHFPDLKAPSSVKDDFRVMDGGGLVAGKAGKTRTDVAFARWHHVHPIGVLIHEGSWVDCDPGCCMSLGALNGFKVRANSAREPANESLLPGPTKPMKRP